MINYHLLLARRHGKTLGEPLLIGLTDDTAALTRKYEELTGPGVAAFAKDYAEILFVSNGTVLANHDFPDPSEVAKAAKARNLAEALKLQSAADKAKADLDAAKQRHAEAAAAVKQLTPEQKALIAEAADTEAKAKADAKARRDADEKAAAEAKSAADQRAAETRAAADRAAARDTFMAELSTQTDAELRALCVASQIEPSAVESRDAAIAALARAAGFES